MPVPSQGLLAEGNTVLLLCPRTRQQTVDGICTGIQPSAFRVDEDGISVTWLEYFQASAEPLQAAALALKSERAPSKTGVLAHARVARILEVGRKLRLEGVSVSHTPTDLNEGHSSILGWANDPGVMLALTFAFHEFTPNTSIPGFVD